MSEAARINSPEVTVSELSASLKRTLEDAYGFVRVRGELGNVKYHSSGHVYLDLKDDRACISGVIWRTTAARIKTKLEAGLEVVVTGRITTYAGRSQYQLVIDTLAPAGLGALMALLEERKRKLTAEGLFEASRKQLLPFLPHVIGVVTSPTGAVIRDILHRLEDRFPRHVVVWPVRVQGEGAAEQVAAAIRGFNALAPGGQIAVPNVIIVARGGGSLEDLWAFNEDIVVRAAADSLIPLISAVGHETDVTLIDFAADKRAPTPTAAAEMAVPVRADLLAQVDGIARRSRACWTRGQERRRTELRSAARALPTPDRLLAEPRQRCDLAGAGLLRGLRVNAQAHRAALARLETRLAPQAPGARLARVGDRVRAFEDRARRAQAVTLRRKTDALANVAGRLAAAMRANRAAHAALVARRREALAALAARSERAFSALIDARYGSLERLADLLAAFSYHGVLARGFALVRDAAGAPVRSAVAVAPGNPIDIEFADGRLPAIATGGAVSAAAPAPVRRRPRRRAEAAAGQGNLFDGSI